MGVKELTRAAVISGSMTLLGAGVAFADEATINETGPDSTNKIKIEYSSNLNVNNTNTVTVTNNNKQSATSGNAYVANNTTGGNATSGNASNANSTSTTVTIGNEVPGGGGSGSGGGQGSGGGAGSGSGQGGAGGSGGGSTSAATGGLGGGLAYGGVGGGVSTLPEVGCSTICDVSALRAGYSDNVASQATERAKGISALLLSLAAVLSLAGAGGSAFFARKQG